MLKGAPQGSDAMIISGRHVIWATPAGASEAALGRAARFAGVFRGAGASAGDSR